MHDPRFQQPYQQPYVPPVKRQSSWSMAIFGCGTIAVIAFFGIALVGIVMPEDNGSATPAVTVTVTKALAAPSATQKAAAPKATKTKAKVVKVKVPNMVGRNHQEAQDYLQSLGFYGLAEEDATGQGRLLLFDRNWQVVRQSPRAGTMADPETATITLYSKKIGE
jgi:hypothetical protein